MTTLADVRPDLKKYYKSDLNDGKLMSEIKRASNRPIILSCDVCTWEKTTSSNRLTKPYKDTFSSTFKCLNCNSLGTNYPDISKEWHPEKNIKTPFEVGPISNKKAWWICPKGHEYEAYIQGRTLKNAGCPACNNSKGEKRIADWFVENNINHIIQYSADGSRRCYDFYLPQYHLFIEVHGKQHFENNPFFTTSLNRQQEIDNQKQEYAETHGYYMMIDYREHKPDLALERFQMQFNEFLKNL